MNSSAVESYNSNKWRFELQVGDNLDALDGDDMWYEAQVIACDKKNITVRFMGWSSRWNAVFLRSSSRISQRNTKVPDWRKTLKLGKGVEVSGDSSTWCSAVICNFNSDKSKMQVFRAPSCTKEWYDINSPLIAEPYTHCGYKVEADSIERRRMLNARRELFKSEMKIVESDKDAHVQKQVGDDLARFVNNRELSDIAFKFGENDPIVYCHKMILVARSPYFRSMLLGGMMESKCEVIEIHDISRDAFLEVINMIYTGKTRALNHENVYELLQASAIYCLPSLREQVVSYLENSINDETAIDILIIADTFDLNELGEKCIKWAIVNYSRSKETKLADQLKDSGSQILSNLLTDELAPGAVEQKLSDSETFMITLAQKFQMSLEGVNIGKYGVNEAEKVRGRINSH